MNDTARGLASFGRGGDTELIHMSKGEIRGLQQLALAHGGSLTINPHTGLPEAGFLKSLLPMIIGGALTATGVGAPLAALMVGGGYGLASGSLMKGLQAGIGAYGGAGLGEGLASMGAATSEATQAQALANASSGSGANLVTQNTPMDTAFNMPSDSFTPAPSLPASPVPAAPTSAVQLPSEIAGVSTAAAVPSSAYSPTPELAPSNIANNPGYYNTPPGNSPILGSQKLGDMASGLGQLNSTQGWSTLGNKVGMGTIGAALTPTLVDTMYPERKGVGMGAYQPDQYDQRLARYHLAENYQPYVPAQPDPYYRAQYAKGGVAKYEGRDPRSASIPDVGIIKLDDISTANKDPYEAALIRLKEAASRANLNYAAPTIVSTPASPALKGLGDIGKPTAMMAAGGSLGGYSDGGHLLKGPGDGMSDNIPATINRKQPARLADGEFVVPADVVSHLGNGSTDAGAKKLYAMLNKVRTARTGRKAQGRQINPNKFMPA